MTSRERIGTRIANIRKEKGYTVRRLAEIANIRPATISNVENGKFSVGIDILARICDALEVKIEII
ncbi:helix-turn-helix domain-containing protein [Parabacteroides sp. ZJ-118]|uniref:helix-turn-helix domain-containing protein n=1 Tax=Parabacteroides sp. ZJ-118 TaxID=2709398 RepID=UPI0013EA16BD|nr:helix-turn-helix transcriptional regulator [Parabacteroides sp. ZJ-118]